MRLIKIALVINILVIYNQGLIAQNNNNMELATFGSGCFWCTEAIFEQLKGVESAKSGYTGGQTKNPTYEEVCTGETGHAEVIQVSFNPEIITYQELLDVFWQTHDPTTLNRQGTDVGTQYRSAIFYHNKEQKEIAESYKNKLDEAKIYDNLIVTEISEFSSFYIAENYHQDYYNSNKTQPYCSFVITPKMKKFKKVFEKKLK
jgi:peptide-methionine (S)-S-oxide reductase